MLTDLPPNLQWYRAALLIVIALCTYLHIPLVSGGRLLVPSFPTIALSPFLFLIVWRNVSLDDAIFLLKIIFVLMLSIALSPGYVHISEKILSLVQCCLALAVTVMIVRLMQQLRRELLERALLVLWCLIIAGSVLELAGVIREASDAFREWAYEGTYTLYRGDYRDMNYVGWLRPKLFSTEPSHVTTMFIATINSLAIDPSYQFEDRNRGRGNRGDAPYHGKSIAGYFGGNHGGNPCLESPHKHAQQIGDDSCSTIDRCAPCGVLWGIDLFDTRNANQPHRWTDDW
jgi:hypothetical protein